MKIRLLGGKNQGTKVSRSGDLDRAYPLGSLVHRCQEDTLVIEAHDFSDLTGAEGKVFSAEQK